ncbi:unnamed protein product [Blepharisma stoltei]|uniref:Peptidase C45 hydrolase domain-containing protein n=1 Tax=Blepharisma stoltei TaxID=1481888 RepID=A0AAU9IN63_9CILI|nr:unnamed protein product [Blepharisma stoltei]
MKIIKKRFLKSADYNKNHKKYKKSKFQRKSSDFNSVFKGVFKGTKKAVNEFAEKIKKKSSEIINFPKIKKSFISALKSGVHKALSLLSNQKRFVVNLNEDPDIRWKEIIVSKMKYIKLFTYFAKEELDNFEINSAYKKLKKANVSDEMKKELAGLSKISGIPYKFVLVMNFMYEFYAACTAIVVKNSDNNLLIARNLDYYFGEIIGNLVIHVDFHKDGQLLYSAVTFAGYIGVITGIKPGAFAIAMNQRDILETSTILDTLRKVNGLNSSAFAIRDALETKQNFKEATEFLKNIPLIAGVYYIIAGSNRDEAAVITRNRHDVDDIWNFTKNKWYLVQTNYDRWQNPPKEDDRLHPAQELLNIVGKNSIDEDYLLQILSTQPIKNEFTIHSTILDPLTGKITNIVY